MIFKCLFVFQDAYDETGAKNQAELHVLVDLGHARDLDHSRSHYHHQIRRLPLAMSIVSTYELRRSIESNQTQHLVSFLI